jgi:hypothetical protein
MFQGHSTQPGIKNKTNKTETGKNAVTCTAVN